MGDDEETQGVECLDVSNVYKNTRDACISSSRGYQGNNARAFFKHIKWIADQCAARDECKAELSRVASELEGPTKDGWPETFSQVAGAFDANPDLKTGATRLIRRIFPSVSPTPITAAAVATGGAKRRSTGPAGGTPPPSKRAANDDEDGGARTVANMIMKRALQSSANKLNEVRESIRTLEAKRAELVAQVDKIDASMRKLSQEEAEASGFQEGVREKMGWIQKIDEEKLSEWIASAMIRYKPEQAP